MSFAGAFVGVSLFMSERLFDMSGYIDCGCRDCSEITIGEQGEFCDECVEAGCEEDSECCRSDAYGCEEPSEPEEGDITTTDHVHFYCNGKLIPIDLTVDSSTEDMWKALRGYMAATHYWPNVWFISDHGNAHLMVRALGQAIAAIDKAEGK